jgi:Helix-turn-helix domain
MNKKILSTRIADQCARLLDELRLRSMTTVEIRRDLDIMMPAARIFDLKADGENIITSLEVAETRPGHRHKKVARYALLSGEADGVG